MSIEKQANSKLEGYLDKLKDLSKPISLRSGMLINSPYKYLGSKLNESLSLFLAL